MIDAPFIWFGGKRRVAPEVWARFGNVNNFVEPFFGSGAVLFGRPEIGNIETINDLDGFVSNFWRAVKLSPEATAEHADYPVNENDLHARHAWLVSQADGLRERLEGDPEYHDPKIAGWWVWGINCWIGSGWCSGNGPWKVVDARLIKGDSGTGVNRQRPHLGDSGAGVNRKLPHLGDSGQGSRLIPWFMALSDRLSRVRVCSGDWSRVCGPSVTWKHGMTGVFLDPPYAEETGREMGLYRIDSIDVSTTVREWAIANGDNPLMRIALCGYAGEHVMPDSWSVHEWQAVKGYGVQSQAEGGKENRDRERIWFSPACISPDAPAQGTLF